MKSSIARQDSEKKRPGEFHFGTLPLLLRRPEFGTCRRRGSGRDEISEEKKKGLKLWNFRPMVRNTTSSSQKRVTTVLLFGQKDEYRKNVCLSGQNVVCVVHCTYTCFCYLLLSHDRSPKKSAVAVSFPFSLTFSKHSMTIIINFCCFFSLPSLLVAPIFPSPLLPKYSPPPPPPPSQLWKNSPVRRGASERKSAKHHLLSVPETFKRCEYLNPS